MLKAMCIGRKGWHEGGNENGKIIYNAGFKKNEEEGK